MPLPQLRTLVMLLLVGSVPSAASARSTIMALVPNGSLIGCNLCHTAGGGTPRNNFGLLFAGGGTWAAAYALDTDGDGYSNGAELGDPDGDGTGVPTFPVTHPAQAAQYPCGSNTIEGPELCDGTLVNGETCATQSLYDAGVLRCNAACDGYDTTGCLDEEPVPVGCGNGAVEAGEQCDNGVANSDTAPNACRTNCTYPVCGDGVVDTNYDETCDDAYANSDTRADACRTDCTNDACGDGVRDTPEQCDEGLGNSNVLASACRLDCTNFRCGDGVIDVNEGCDDGPGNGPAGPCNAACVPLSCGNGALDAGEECDNGAGNSNVTPDACRTICREAGCGDQVDDTGEECDWGFFGSDDPDSCRTDCSLPYCGDGVVDQFFGEACDAGAGNVDEADEGECRSDCQYPVCGDGVVDPGEECDSDNRDECSEDCVAATPTEPPPNNDPFANCSGAGAGAWGGLTLLALALLRPRRRR